LCVTTALLSTHPLCSERSNKSEKVINVTHCRFDSLLTWRSPHPTQGHLRVFALRKTSRAERPSPSRNSQSTRRMCRWPGRSHVLRSHLLFRVDLSHFLLDEQLLATEIRILSESNHPNIGPFPSFPVVVSFSESLLFRSIIFWRVFKGWS
jgi:hypothetical protein